MKPVWIVADWPAPSNVCAGTTLRQNGVSTGVYTSLNLADHVADEAETVAENRRRFVADCRLPAEPVWLRQMHSVNVVLEGPSDRHTAADALVTRQPNTVAVVLSADCLPVVFAAANGNEVAVAHAGWRGLCGGILEATVAAMAARPADILVWLGPAIAQPAFEVGGEVRDQFVSHEVAAASQFILNARGRYQADLYGLAHQRLASVGVSAVFGGERCTYAESVDFFSYRRDGQCGRMATFVYRREAA